MSFMNKFTDAWILAQRSSKNVVSHHRPYQVIFEKECTGRGTVAEVLTIFLTNKECPFRCLMCDLWKNTTDYRVSEGAIPEQISWALDNYPPAPLLKLYNSGNFFDVQAIPTEDYKSIARLISAFERVTVECHPKLVNSRCLQFRDLLPGQLEVAMGLETVHSEILHLLNKHMTLVDFDRTTAYLVQNQIQVRAFILLRPPFLDEEEGIFWAKQSIDFAFNCGVTCCVIIPTRSGNGAMDYLKKQGWFHPPQIHSLEKVLAYGIQKNQGLVLADLWDLKYFSSCEHCYEKRAQRLEQMNLTQVVPSPVHCEYCD
ncbi:MAG: radical SAM protein [Calditrichaeota bacterium]|nr:MAG: radical SAM protein [Calditrichota bacterium]